jgi:Family of unknown function (DUF6307)
MNVHDPVTARPLYGYEARVDIATRALIAHSELPADEARALAKHVLYAIDHIPERIR